MKYSFLIISGLILLGAMIFHTAHRQPSDEKIQAGSERHSAFHTKSLAGSPSQENGSESTSFRRQLPNDASENRSKPPASPSVVTSTGRRLSPMRAAKRQLIPSATLSEETAPNSPNSITFGGGTPLQSSSAGQMPEAISLNALANQRLPNMPAAIFETDSSVNDPAISAGLDEIARDFVSAMETSGLAPDSIAYLRLWNLQQLIADTRFKTRFGGAAWMKHHLATRVIPTHQTTPAR